MRVLVRSFALVLAAGTLGACVPYPHQETVIPPLTGRVSRSGAPVAGAGVLVGEGYVSCKKTARVALTDGEGRFAFAGTTSMRVFAAIGGSEPYHDLTVCIDYGGRAWAGSYWTGPGLAKVECDLDRARPNEVPGVCVNK
jgi:hypothetical protein